MIAKKKTGAKLESQIKQNGKTIQEAYDAGK